MRELSLHILDIAQNSIAAGASLVTIDVNAEPEKDLLTISVTDDGCGMPEELAKSAADPFTTTRQSRRVGLGISLLQASAQRSEGNLTIRSAVGKGTAVSATFRLRHIDRPPMGDLAETMAALIAANPEKPDFLLKVSANGRYFSFDTREVKRRLTGVSLSEPEVLAWVRDHLHEGLKDFHGGAPI